MATYYTDFGSYEHYTGGGTGQLFDQGWTNRWFDNNDWWIEDNANAVSGGNILRHDTGPSGTSSGTHGHTLGSWDIVNADPDIHNVEVIGLTGLRTAQFGGNHNRLYVRASGSEGSETAYAAELRNDSELRIVKLSGGTFTVLGTVSFAWTASGDWHWVRFRVNTDPDTGVVTLQAKAWNFDDTDPDGLDEPGGPADWVTGSSTLTVTDESSPITSGGWVGFGRHNHAYGKRLDRIGVATDGEIAPRFEDDPDAGSGDDGTETLVPGDGWEAPTDQPDSTGPRPCSDTTVNVAANTITIGCDWSTIDPITIIGFSTTGTMPGGLSQKYYWCTVVGSTITVYPTKDAAVAGTGEVDLTSEGTGTLTATPWGSNENAIARWDVVPCQLVDETFRIGIAAWHATSSDVNDDGIDRVAFSLENGPWVEVEEPTLNPRTDVVEFCVDFDPSTVDDGRVEIRAIVYPRNGVPRVLQGEVHDMGEADGQPNNGEMSCFLHANTAGAIVQEEAYVSWALGSDTAGDGTSGNPYKTIHKGAKAVQQAQGHNDGGGIVYLMAGEHPWVGWSADGNSGNVPTVDVDTTWLIITRDPTEDRADVRITDTETGDGQGLRAHLVAVHGVTIERGIATAQLSGTHTNPTVWLDDCHFTRHDPRDLVDDPADFNDTHDTRFAGSSWVGGVFCTNSTANQVRNFALSGWFSRNVHCSEIGADAFRSPVFIANCSVATIGGYGLREHADVSQWSGTGYENNIIYGLTAVDDARSQLIFSRRSTGSSDPDGMVRDMALINCDLEGTSYQDQWQQRTRHMVVDNHSRLGRNFWFRNDSKGVLRSEVDVLRVQGSTFHEVANSTDTDDDQFRIGFRDNIFLNGEDWDESTEVMPADTVPGRPVDLTASATGTTSIALSWETPPSDGGATITGYKIERESPVGGGWSTIVADTGSTATAYEDDGLTIDTEYNYRVSAINSVGTGSPSDPAADTTSPPFAPSAPQDFTAVYNTDTGKVDLAWTAPASDGGADITNYRINRRIAGTLVIYIFDTDSVETTYEDEPPKPATWTYSVQAENSAGRGDWSTSVEVVVPEPPEATTARRKWFLYEGLGIGLID